MKQTEIGLIPDDWEVKKLEEICYQIGDIDHKMPASVSNGIPYLMTGDFIGENEFNFADSKKISLADYNSLSKKIKPELNDVIFARYASIGAVRFIEAIKPFLVSYSCAILKIKDSYEKKFVFYSFFSNILKNQEELAINTGTQANIGIESLKNFLLPIPSLAEQQHIAKALSDVDTLISTTEKLIQKKKNIKQGTMQNLLTGKKRLPGFAKSTNYKQSELGLIPDDWEVKNIMDILISSKDKLKIGPFGSQLKKEYLLSNGFYKVFGQENIYTGNFEYCYRFLTKEHFQKLQSCELKPGDFVISTMGTIGKCDIVPENAGVGVMDSHLVRLRLLNSMDKNFFKYFFQSDLIQKQIVALSVGGIMDGLSTAIIKKLNVIEFSKEEQTAIANVLSSMDNEIETLNTKLEKYRNLKTAMMQQLLTGKIRLV